jgi:hypothetical protein
LGTISQERPYLSSTNHHNAKILYHLKKSGEAGDKKNASRFEDLRVN